MKTETIESKASPSDDDVLECPNCGSRAFDRDSAAGEIYCRECGTVVEEDKLDTSGPRTFSAEDRQDKERSGSSITYTRHDKGISTEIGSGAMQGMSGEKRGQYYRLRKWHSRSSDSKSRNIKTALRHIDDIVNQLNLPESVEEEAARMYEKAVDEEVVKGRKIEKIAASIVFIVARNQNIPRTMKEFSEASGISERELGKNYRYVSKELDVNVQTIRPESFVPRYASKLDLSGETQADARELILDAREKGLTSGRSPDGIAAAALYMSAKKNDEKITQREIADIAGVTEVTIRKGTEQLGKIEERENE
ncbi:MAG: transcription initiation factor IIB family protein [Candidatus Nanohalobium sp.]